MNGVRFVALLFAVAIASNLFGNTTLAEILVVAPVRSAYSAALIFAGAHLLMTLIVVALQSPPMRWLRSVQVYGELIALRSRTLVRLAAIVFWTVVNLYVLGISVVKT